MTEICRIIAKTAMDVKVLSTGVRTLRSSGEVSDRVFSERRTLSIEKRAPSGMKSDQAKSR
jgi:hypothetical protein